MCGVTINKGRDFIFLASTWVCEDLCVGRIRALGTVATLIESLWGFREPGRGERCIHVRVDKTVSEASGASEREESVMLIQVK